MKIKSLLLIDPGTSGCAGLYIAEIYENLHHRDNVEVAVSYYFKEKYGKKIFYKYSDLVVQAKYRLGKLRLYVRGCELIYALLRMLLYLLGGDVKVVCYALSSNVKLELWFLWIAKRILRLKICIICHDVIPFIGPDENLDAKVRWRARFYHLADTLIVHNANSFNELVRFFKVPPYKVREFPFPVSNIQRLRLGCDSLVEQPIAGRSFLFIGHLRQEKGIEVDRKSVV